MVDPGNPKRCLSIKNYRNINTRPLLYNIEQGIFAKIGPDLELRGGDLISSPVDSIVSLVSPKKVTDQTLWGKILFRPRPFSLLAKNATGGHNA